MKDSPQIPKNPEQFGTPEDDCVEAERLPEPDDDPWTIAEEEMARAATDFSVYRDVLQGGFWSQVHDQEGIVEFQMTDCGGIEVAYMNHSGVAVMETYTDIHAALTAFVRLTHDLRTGALTAANETTSS